MDSHRQALGVESLECIQYFEDFEKELADRGGWQKEIPVTPQNHRFRPFFLHHFSYAPLVETSEHCWIDGKHGTYDHRNQCANTGCSQNGRKKSQSSKRRARAPKPPPPPKNSAEPLQGLENEHKLFLHNLFEHPQGSRTSRQNSRDIPGSERQTFEGGQELFDPTPLCSFFALFWGFCRRVLQNLLHNRNPAEEPSQRTIKDLQNFWEPNPALQILQILSPPPPQKKKKNRLTVRTGCIRLLIRKT